MSSQSQSSNNPSSTNKLQSLDDISHCFSLPLSDAASLLGVCTSVLKKICRDNGLDRWPYRKVLAGKSIEDIKKDAAREKSRELAELLKTSRQSGNGNKEVPKAHNAALPHSVLQQGSKIMQLGRPHNLLSASLTRGIKDEFKYGFPSDGLSIVSNKWWGSGDGARTQEEDKEKAEPMEGGPNAEDNDKSNVDSRGCGLLRAVRKRTVEEGREALRLGVCRSCGPKKLGKRERALLVQIFGSSLPKGWLSGSC